MTGVRLLALLVVGMLARPAAADVRWKDGSPVTDDQVKKLAEEVKQSRAKANLPAEDATSGSVFPWVWVAYEGYEPRAVPGGPAAGTGKVRFLQKLTWLAVKEQMATGEFYLLASGSHEKGDLKPLGWVDKRYLVLDREAVREGTTTLYRKAMVVNRLDPVKQAAKQAAELAAVDQRAFGPAPVRTVPDPAAPPSDAPLRFFRIFFVWADTDPTRADGDEAASDGFVLLGEKESADQVPVAAADSLRDVSGIVGWVPKNRLLMWKTREGLRWEPNPARGEPVKAYMTRADAMKSAAEPNTRVPTDAVEAPFKNGEPVKWTNAQPRFPVLPMDDESGKPLRDKRTGQPKMCDDSLDGLGGKLYRIAFIGGVAGADGRAIDAGGGAEVASLQERVAVLRQQMATTEVMFVIDDSKSMDDWHPRAAAAIRSLLEDERRRGRKLRAGVTYYSDVKDGKGTPAELAKAIAVTPLKDAGGRDFDAMLDELTRHKMRPEFPGGDPPELLFLGLRTALAPEHGWTQWARKLVVLIGDTGDHDTNPSGKWEQEERIARLLAPDEQSAFELIVLHASADQADRGGKDEIRFREQTRQIARRLNDRLEDWQKIERYYSIRNEDGVLDALRGQQRRIAARADELDKLAQRLGNGQVSAEQVAQFQAREFNQFQDDPKLKAMLGGVQVYDFRYVFENTPMGVRQVREQLLLSSGDVDAVVRLLSRKDERAGQAVQLRLDDLIENIAGKQGGEGQSGNAVLRVKYGFAFRGPLFDFALADARKRTKTEADDLLMKLYKRRLLLEDVRDKQEWTYRPLDDDEKKDKYHIGRVGSSPKKDGTTDRFYYPDPKSKTVGWVWIDVEKEWP